MKKCLLAIWASFAVCGAQGEMPADAMLRYWTTVVQGPSFEEVLAVFSNGPEMEWPAVHSELFPQSGENATRDAAYRVLEAKLLRGLEAFEKEMRSLPEAEFLSRADMLLSMRDHFARHAAYANLLFVDAIDSCVAANLGARLVQQAGVSGEMLALLDRLEKGHPDLAAFCEMARGELADAWPADKTWSKDEDPDGQKRLAELWKFLMPGIPIGWPGTETRVDLETLLNVQACDGLLVRLVSWDLIIHTFLPSMARYRQAAPDAPSHVICRDLRSVLGVETPAPISLGTVPFGVKRAASAASELNDDVISGKIWARIAFSRDRIETWDAARHSGKGAEKGAE